MENRGLIHCSVSVECNRCREVRTEHKETQVNNFALQMLKVGWREIGGLWNCPFCSSPEAPPVDYVHGGQHSCLDLNPDGQCVLWEEKRPEPIETRWWGWVWQIIRGGR